MLMVISPAKTLDYTSTPVTRRFTQPEHLDQAQLLINQLRKLTPAQIAELMSLSDPLAGLNAARYTSGQEPVAVTARQEVLREHLFQGVDETMHFTVLTSALGRPLPATALSFGA